MTIKNADYWAEIEELPAFKNKPINKKDNEEYDLAWKHLESLQKEGKLRGLDLIILKALLENVYEIGRKAGVEEEKEVHYDMERTAAMYS